MTRRPKAIRMENSHSTLRTSCAIPRKIPLRGRSPGTPQPRIHNAMYLVRRGVVAYGKLFAKKAGLVSREWYPGLANYRRNGYDSDARYEDGLASHRKNV